MGFARGLLGRLGLRRNKERQDPDPAHVTGAVQPTLTLSDLRAALNGPEADLLHLDEAVAARASVDTHGGHARALILVAWRRWREAAAIYDGVAFQPGSTPALCVDAGWCFHLLGQHAKAKACMERALERDPGLSEAIFGSAVVDMALGRFAQARSGLRHLADTQPSYPDLWVNLGHAECALGNLADAEAAAREAVTRSYASANAWSLLGQVLRLRGRAGEAFEVLSRARACESVAGVNGESTVAQATMLVESGKAQEAIELCEAALLAGSEPGVSGMYSIALLTRGYLLDGFRQFEFRWFDEPMRSLRVRLERPLWAGQPVAGKTILLTSEQGIGDAIQFARYASLLKAQGATVILCAHAGMARLASRFEGVDRVIESISPALGFDYHISLMSLPRAFATQLGNVPSHVPYASADPALACAWERRLSGDLLRVGVVWSGNPKHRRDVQRSIPLRLLAPLWKQQGVRFYLLQRDVRPADAPFLPPQGGAIDLAPELVDLEDTAAVVSHMDLVISVDTAVAHLAGALGKPVWLLLPKVSDFRWLEDRTDSPWYPTLRIFRQAVEDDWASVVTRVVSELSESATVRNGELPAAAPVTPCDSPHVRAASVSSLVPQIVEAREGILQYIPDRDDEARSLEWFGEYLAPQVDSLVEQIPRDAWVVEVGSGVGSHAIWLTGVLSNDAQIFCYESRPVERLLRQNIAANRMTDRITVPRGQLKGNETDGFTRGALHTIDQLRLERLDLVKIRSAWPHEILAGCERSVWRCRPRLVVDVEVVEGIAETTAWLKSLGYRVWRRQVPLYRADNFAGQPVDRSRGRIRIDLLAVPEECEFTPAPQFAPEAL